MRKLIKRRLAEVRKDHSKYNYNFARDYRLTEELIIEFQDWLSWEHVCTYQKLSEDFMRRFEDKIHWRIISYTQKLSESFMREFKDRLDWRYLCFFQKMSPAFKAEFYPVGVYEC